jgi:hypothetical protein
MNLNDLANIGQVIGAVAVVVSLFYVAHQIRQNTNAVRSATAQTVHEHFANWYHVLASDPVLSQIAAKGLRDYTSLSEQERSQVHRGLHVVPFLLAECLFEVAPKITRSRPLAGLGVCHHESSLRAGRQGVLERSRLYVWRGIPPLRRERSDEKGAASRRKAAGCFSNRPVH